MQKNSQTTATDDVPFFFEATIRGVAWKVTHTSAVAISDFTHKYYGVRVSQIMEKLFTCRRMIHGFWFCNVNTTSVYAVKKTISGNFSFTYANEVTGAAKTILAWLFKNIPY